MNLVGRRITVGGVQFTRRTGNKEYNMARAEEFIRAAAGRGAKIVSLPELFSTGLPDTYDERYFAWAEPIPGPVTEHFAGVARDLGIYVIAPIWEQDNRDGLRYNSAAVITPRGDIAGLYRKRHVTLGTLERRYCQPGNMGYPVFGTEHCRLGITICYDRHFPETYRHLALGGVQVVFGVNNASKGRSKRLWLPEIMCHASCSGIFIVHVNAIGEPREFFGGSAIVDPEGNLVAQLDDKQEGTIVAELDLDRINVARQHYQLVDTDLTDFGLVPRRLPFLE